MLIKSIYSKLQIHKFWIIGWFKGELLYKFPELYMDDSYIWKHIAGKFYYRTRKWE